MNHKLIMGLGNPDPTLEGTYHNVGVLAVRWMAEHAMDGASAPKFRAHRDEFAYAKVGAYIFILPLVFMNESYRAVKEAMRTFNASAKDLIIIHDDSDIAIGDFKYSDDGGSAGHKGIQSIIDHLHTTAFARIRIGIRKKDEIRRRKAEEFVLSPMSAKDEEVFEEVFEKISDVLLFDTEAKSGNR
jgi:PTH1 family peptidyl-tRNA hydrolase